MEIAGQEMETATAEFSRVVALLRPRIFRFLLASTRDVDLAETLTQECFLKAHRHWGSFRGDSSAMTWLMRIAINLQKDHWRNRRMQFWRHTRTNAVDVDEASEWLASGESSAEQQLLAKEQVRHVWRAVKELSERQRTVFLLRYVEEQELSEIALATGLSEGTVKAHLFAGAGESARGIGGKAMNFRKEFGNKQDERAEEAAICTELHSSDEDLLLEQALENFRSSVHAWSAAELSRVRPAVQVRAAAELAAGGGLGAGGSAGGRGRFGRVLRAPSTGVEDCGGGTTGGAAAGGA